MFNILVMLVLVAVFIFIGYDVLSGKEDDIGPVDVVHSHPLSAKKHEGR